MREATLSLTGKNSHHLKISLSQGSVAIGCLGMDEENFDLLVDPNLPIDWSALDKAFPDSYVSWPRFIYYYGNDLGFIEWTRVRETERFTWCPNESISADFSNTKISRLDIISQVKIEVTLGKHAHLRIADALNKITIKEIGDIELLSFTLPQSKEKKAYSLPIFDALKEIENISIYTDPIECALDCKSLLQFKNLKRLSLYGKMYNISLLSEFKNLQSLEFRFVPDLEGLQPLHKWKELNYFIAWNVEETMGKKLRTELNKLKKEREFKYASVSKLRKKIWFSTEYGIPFSAWEAKDAKKATKIYKATLKQLKKVEDKKEIISILVNFIKAFNDFSTIETSEREDVFTALNQLRQTAKIVIDSKDAEKLFGQNSDY